MELCGGAGHSYEIAKKLSKSGLLIGIDRDKEAISAAKEKMKDLENVIYYHGNHDNIKNILDELKIKSVDGILLDLGVSSYQLDERNRGFSYIGDANLDMRMDTSQELTAKMVVNEYKEEQLIKIFFEYGEEKFSKNIARKICEYRKNKQIETTKELVDIIETSIPNWSKNKNSHPAKRVFQAIRIEVNDEISPLYNTVRNSIKCLKSGGRLCIMSYHIVCVIM